MNAKVIQVIVTEHCRGLGITEDPRRIVTGYHSLDGELLAEVDPCGNLAAEKESTTVTKSESVTLVDRNTELSEVKAKRDILLYQLKECESIRDEMRVENRKLRTEVSQLKDADFHLAPPVNPALENVLAKLREYCGRHSGCADDYKILSSGKDIDGLNFGDLRRWVESEKVT